MKIKLLFITHETTRSGAPMVVLHFLKWLKKHRPEVVADVVTLEEGSLEADFKTNCSNFYNYAAITKSKPLPLFKKILLKLGILKKQDLKELFLFKLVKNNYDLVYANTIITIPFASTIVKESIHCKFIGHLHELDVMIKKSLPNLNDYLPIINQFIVPSNLVKTNLISNWSIPEHNIDVVYECAKIDNLIEPIKKDKVFIVGASGLVHWRKGHDVFLQVARYINSHYPELSIKYVWVGRVPHVEKIILEADIKKLGLKDVVEFTGEIENPSSYYNNFDVFMMPSREDPFPLVCIEVGMLGKPIISFEQATGSNEIIKQGGGFIVPYLNIEAMADGIITYYKDRSLIKTHGAINKSAFSQFTPEHICPKLFETIESNLKHES